MRFRALATIAAAIIGSAIGASAQGAPLGHASWHDLSRPYAVPRPHTRAVRRALALWERATNDVEHSHRRCRARSTPSSLTHAPPSADLLALAGLLRQPPEPGDRPSPDALRRLPGVDVYVDWVRATQDRSGREFYVYGSRDLADIDHGPPICGTLERRRLRHLLIGEPRHIARIALRTQDRFDRWRHPTRPSGPVETVSLFERDGDELGPTGTSWSVTSFRTIGVWLSWWEERHITVLLPDGVAAITAIYPRVGRKPPRGPRKVYAKQVEVTVPVQENVTSFTPPRRRWDYAPSRVVWRAADGSTIRTTRPPPYWWLFF